MSKTLPECMRCEFFEPQDDLVGECRRQSPRPALAGGLEMSDPDEMMALWPVVAQDDWCGEFVEASRNRSVRNQSLTQSRLQEAHARLARRPVEPEGEDKTEASDTQVDDE